MFERHSKWNTPEYRAWHNMIQRCHNPENTGYYNYGNRGIKVCDRWRYSFKNFFEDVGAKPSPELTLERIDNDKGYEPGNVVWIDRECQANNRRKSLNKYGHLGIFRSSNGRGWYVQIKGVYLGYYQTLEEAASISDLVMNRR